MENKNVKVIDEHGIDRDANIICGFIVDKCKYVLYSIERDEENDNLFVSELKDNLDKTSDMVNIDIGKEKISEIVKELVKYSINNENDTTNGQVVLPSGNTVEITDVLFNKDQNINVTKTYVSTVKKSVTKVSEDFYKVENKKEDDLDKTTIIEPLPKDEVIDVPSDLTEPEMIMPEINLSEEVPTLEEKEPLKEVNDQPVIENNELLKTEEKLPVEPLVTTPLEEIKVETPSFTIPPVEQVQEIKPQPELKVPETLLESQTSDNIPVVEPKVEESKEKLPEVNEELKIVSEPVPSTEEVKPLQVVSDELEKVEAPTTIQPKLFFDGTDENNLNKALDEVSDEKIVPTPQEDVESLREFGIDEPTPVTLDEPAEVKTLTRSKGFANNKFFMVIAIAFFVAACIFLGYEAFQYFSLK